MEGSEPVLLQIWDGVSNCVNSFIEAHNKEPVGGRVLAAADHVNDHLSFIVQVSSVRFSKISKVRHWFPPSSLFSPVVPYCYRVLVNETVELC